MTDRSDQTDWQRSGDELNAPTPPTHRSLASGDLDSAWELDEFFQALGPVMRLPPKEKEPKPAERRAKVPTGRRRPRVLILTAVTLLMVGAFQAPLVGLLTRDGPVPDEFLGTWETSSQRYAERGFTITSDSLRLHLGPRGVASYPITGVRAKRTADSVLYTFHYRDGSSTLEMGLRMDPDSALRLGNLPAVLWRKVSR
jgi:hypothetical protein